MPGEMEEYNFQPLQNQSVFPDVTDYGGLIRLTESTRKMLSAPGHVEKKQRAPMHRGAGLGRFSQNQSKRVHMASRVDQLSDQVRFQGASLAAMIQ